MLWLWLYIILYTVVGKKIKKTIQSPKSPFPVFSNHVKYMWFSHDHTSLLLYYLCFLVCIMLWHFINTFKRLYQALKFTKRKPKLKKKVSYNCLCVHACTYVRTYACMYIHTYTHAYISFIYIMCECMYTHDEIVTSCNQ